MTIPLDIGNFLLVVFTIKPLSPAFLEILGHKDNGVMSFTFVCHVTSSVTWPFDSTYPISYWCSIVTKPLSLTVFEVLGFKVPDLCKSSLCMRDITWPVPLYKIWAHIRISHPHIAYSLWHFYWAPMKNIVRPPMLNAKSSEVPTKIGQILAVLRVWGSRVSKNCDFYPKMHILAWTHVVWAILRQNHSRGVTSRSVGKKVRKSQRLP